MDKKTTLNTYIWTGTNKRGKKVQGEMNAVGIDVVRAKLQSINIKILKIKQKPKSLFSFLKPKIKFTDIVYFSRHLATMINAKVPLVQALDIISKGIENPTARSLIVAIKTDVESGNSLTSALKKYPRYFDNLYCGLIHSGEQSGTLETMLNRLAVHLEKTQSLKNKIKKACVYPAAIVCAAIAVGVFMLLFIVPQFESLFKTHGAELPLFTQIVIDLSKDVQAYWFYGLVLIVAIVLGFRYARKHVKKFSDSVDLMILKLPIFGKLIKKVIFARFTRTLAITLNAGVPIVDALYLAEDVIKNYVYTTAISQIKTDVETGQQMYFSMETTHLFPNMIVQMVEVGEKTGETKDILHKIADYYDEEVDLAVSNLNSLLEPFIIVLLGGMVATLVISMYMPIFKLGSVF